MLKERLRRTSIPSLGRVAATIALLTAAVPIAGFGAASSRGVDASPTSLLSGPSRGEGAAAAQAGATVSGTLSDQLGGFLPGATVTLSNIDFRGTRTTDSDRGGYFTFNEVTPGEYELEMQLAGFQTHREKVTLQAGQNVQRNVTLPVGSITETVSVRGSRSPDAAVSAPSRPEQAQPGPRRPLDQRAFSACVGAIGGCIDTPRRLNNVNPVYPAGLQASGVAGIVELTGRIGVDGLVTGLAVVGSAHPGLSDAALTAVGQWEFDPTLLNGIPIETPITVTLQFDLQP